MNQSNPNINNLAADILYKAKRLCEITIYLISETIFQIVQLLLLLLILLLITPIFLIGSIIKFIIRLSCSMKFIHLRKKRSNTIHEIVTPGNEIRQVCWTLVVDSSALKRKESPIIMSPSRYPKELHKQATHLTVKGQRKPKIKPDVSSTKSPTN